MSRFFIDRSALTGVSALITGEDAKHIAMVLRLTPGDCVTLCDGCGCDYEARITKVSKTEVALEVLSHAPSLAEPQTKITLYQALPKAGKLESIIQKCVELGIYRIVPVMSARCVVRLTPAQFEAKRARYQRVAYEAAKQSGRGIVPEIAPLLAIADIPVSAYGAFLLPYECERGTSLRQASGNISPGIELGFMIGPEGGFDSEEADMLKEKGAVSVTLGRRILRTETAGPAALSMLMFALEEME